LKRWDTKVTDGTCRGRREDIGAYVLGTLDEDRTTSLIAHLDGCPDCRAEVEELAEVARILALADPVRSTPHTAPPLHLAESIFQRVRAEGRAARRRRIRRAAIGSIGIAAAAAALLVYLAVTGPRRVEVEFVTAPAGVDSHALLEYRPGGTRIELDVAGLPGDQVYNVWLESDDGKRVPAGTFWASKEKPLEVTLTAALKLEDCEGIGVSNSDGRTMLYSELELDD
jgi:hypothetical protein